MRGLTERPLNLENREKRRSSGLHRALAKQDCRDELVENAVKKRVCASPVSTTLACKNCADYAISWPVAARTFAYALQSSLWTTGALFAPERRPIVLKRAKSGYSDQGEHE